MGALNKTLLILSGGREAVEGIKAAKNMGLRVIVCDGDKNAPGRYLADEFILGNIYDPEEVVRNVSAYKGKDKINGVITIASDAVRSVAAAAEHLNLPGISRETAFLSTEKFEMKKCFQRHSIPIPKFADINSSDELKRKIEYFGEAVLKPVDSRGARGVLRVNRNTDLEWAFNQSVRYSPSKKLILEEWLAGPQISTESLAVKGKTYLCGAADRNYSRLDETFPYVIEDGGETPSRFSPEINERLTAVLDMAAKAIGIENGVLKGDIVLKDNSPYIIEVAVRLSGGFFSTVTIPLVYNINIIESAILISLGIEVSPPKELPNYCFQANRFLFIKPGLVKKIIAPEPDALPDYVKYYEISAREGERQSDIKNHTMRKGSVLVYGKTREQAIERAEGIIKGINVEMSEPISIIAGD